MQLRLAVLLCARISVIFDQQAKDKFRFHLGCSFSNRHLLFDLLTTERVKIASFPRSESIAQSDGVANSTMQIRY
jgi:hypothetical protein